MLIRDRYYCVKCGKPYAPRERTESDYGKVFVQYYCEYCRAKLPVLEVITEQKPQS